MHSWLNGTASLSFNHPSWFISALYYVYFIFYLIVGSKNYKQIFIAISIISGLGLWLGVDFIKLGILQGFFCFSLGCIAYWTYEKILNFQLSKLVFDILEATLLGLGYVAITTTFGSKVVRNLVPSTAEPVFENPIALTPVANVITKIDLINKLSFIAPNNYLPPENLMQVELNAVVNRGFNEAEIIALKRAVLSHRNLEF